MITKLEAKHLSTKSILELLTKDLPQEDVVILRTERDRRDARRLKRGKPAITLQKKRKK